MTMLTRFSNWLMRVLFHREQRSTAEFFGRLHEYDGGPPMKPLRGEEG